jgi:hypothetical protein
MPRNDHQRACSARTFPCSIPISQVRTTPRISSRTKVTQMLKAHILEVPICLPFVTCVQIDPITVQTTVTVYLPHALIVMGITMGTDTKQIMATIHPDVHRCTIKFSETTRITATRTAMGHCSPQRKRGTCRRMTHREAMHRYQRDMLIRNIHHT